MRLGACAVLLVPTLALAYQTGINGYSGKMTGTVCTSCHGGGVAPSATISGPTTMVPNSTASFTVTVTAGGLTTSHAGLNVALGGAGSAGAAFTPGGGDTQVVTGELTHTNPKGFDGGITSFSFTVTAGATLGPMTLYVSTLAANKDATNQGDNSYTLNRTVSIAGDAGQPAVDSGTPAPQDAGAPDADGGSGEADAGAVPRSRPAGPPGGFVDGDYGCSSAGGSPLAAWLLGAAAALWLAQRRSTKST